MQEVHLFENQKILNKDVKKMRYILSRQDYSINEENVTKILTT